MPASADRATHQAFCVADPLTIVPPWLVFEPIVAVGFPSVIQTGEPVMILAPQPVRSPTVATGKLSQVDADATDTIVFGVMAEFG
jgi:hypothetical protein